MNDLASFVFATGVCFCSSPTVAGDEWVGLNKGPDPQVSAVIMVSLASKATDGYPIVVVAERHSQCWGLVVLNRIRRREGCGTIRDETMVRFNHAEPIAGPRDTYTIDREQDLPFADVPTGGRRINYFQIGGGA